MVTRRQIDHARPETVLGMVRSWKTSAANLVTAADSYQQSVGKPGGQPWSGATATAAITQAERDRQAVDELRQRIDWMANATIDTMNDLVIPDLNDVRAKIASAEAAGFTVNDDLTITYPPTTPPDPKKKEDAEYRAAQIQQAAATWWGSDQLVANRINVSNKHLAPELNAVGKPSDVRYERLLRAAGLLNGLTPGGYYAQWLANAARRGVAPQVIVEIARRRHITPQNFKILEGMQPITDPDGKSFFLMPKGTSGDDARKAVLMTYILNAGTDYGKAGRELGVQNDFAETPYSADEVQRIINRQEGNSRTYESSQLLGIIPLHSSDVEFVHDHGGRLVTTPNGMLMGLGGDVKADALSPTGTGGADTRDLFMANIDDPEGEAAAQQLREIVKSGREWTTDENGGKPVASNWDLDRTLHHEERHAQQWADGRIYELSERELEKDAGLSDGGYH